jgi:hypothetical protein
LVTAGAFVMLIATAFAGSIVVPARLYAPILGAYRAAPTQSRQQDLAVAWNRFHEEMLVLNWLTLSRKWGVCHGLWSQPLCVPAPLSPEPEGIARELLTTAANGG